MKQYIFPAVFYKDIDGEGFVVAFDDVDLFCVGKTVEEAYVMAKKMFTDFVKLSLKINGEVEEKPRSYMDSAKHHKGNIVLLISAEIRENIITKPAA